MEEEKNILKDYWGNYKDWRKKRKAKLEANKPQNLQQHIWSWTKTIVGAVVVVMFINGLLIASFVVPTGSMENTVMTGDFLFVNKFIYGPSTPQIIPFINVPLPFFKFPGIRDPKQGDVIVFIFPGSREEIESPEFQYYLKRCIATAGDSLVIINKRVYVNGKEFILPPNGKFISNMENPTDRYEIFPKGSGYTRDNYGPIRIPKKGDIINVNANNFIQWEYFIKKEGHEATLENNIVKVDNKPITQYKVERNYCFGMGDNRDNSTDSRFWGFIPYNNVVGTPIMVYWSWETKPSYELDPNVEYSFSEKLKRIRWNRIFNFIK
jgi:signal peptidase I